MKKIANILKTNKYVYFIYNFLFSNIIKFIGLFLKIDNKIILFSSFGGKKYDDSPKVIFEYMINQKKYQKYKFFWVFDEPDKFNVVGAKKIKNNSFKFFCVALKSKFWITNSGIERGLKFKSKKTIYINTWHGTALKHIGIDENNLKVNFKTSKANIMFAQSDYDKKIFSHVFNIPEHNIVVCGLPRNDELANLEKSEIINIKKKLGIPLDKKIILYAPTFREYNRDSCGCILSPPMDLKKWEDKLANNFILLFRAHYEINKVLNLVDNDFVKNYSSYENLNDLLKISDILISDYSSIMIDYSILERPIFNFIYDYDVYKEKRGLYFDLKEKLPGYCIENEDLLLEKLITFDNEEATSIAIKFKKEFVQEYGNARKYIDNIIKEEQK